MSKKKKQPKLSMTDIILNARRMWSINPTQKPHSTKSGKRGYKRNDKRWKDED